MDPETTRSPVARALLTLALVTSTGCSAFVGPDGTWLPKDPGTIVVRVRDDAGAPVAGALVGVEMPNGVGSTFVESRQTDARGSQRFEDVPAGLRRVSVAAPSGLRVVATPLVQDVEVVKGATVTADFVLDRVRGGPIPAAGPEPD